jgi:hypothetical protein
MVSLSIRFASSSNTILAMLSNLQSGGTNLVGALVNVTFLDPNGKLHYLILKFPLKNHGSRSMRFWLAVITDELVPLREPVEVFSYFLVNIE